MSAYTHGSSTFSVSGVTQGVARLVFDQRGGNTWEYTYEGTPSGIEAQAAALQAEGARTSIDNSGPIHRLIASFVRDPNESASAEVPFDTWNISNEEYQVSVFATTRAIEEAGTYINRAQYRSDIEEAVRAGDPYPLSTTEFPVGQVIYSLLSQGIDTQPQKLPVLSRNRTYSLSYTGTRRRITVSPVVYTRAALVRDFGIVSPLADQIPLDPTTTLETGFVWGWYLVREDFSYQRERSAIKVTENLGWRFGAWNAFPAASPIQGLYALIE